MARKSTAELTALKIEKAIDRNWAKFQEWAKEHEAELLKDDLGDTIAPKSREEFAATWRTLQAGSRKLDYIKYHSLYRTDMNDARQMYKRAKELGIETTMKEIKTLGTWEFIGKHSEYGAAIKSFQDTRISEEIAAKKKELGLPDDFTLADDLITEIKKKIRKEASFEFFGGS